MKKIIITTLMSIMILTVIAQRPEIKEKLKNQLKFSEGLAAIELDGKWGFIDINGKEVIPFNYDYADNFNDGLAMVRVGKYPNYKHGFIDKKGKEIIPLIYDRVGKISEGLISVNIQDKWGFIDKTGKEVVPLNYGGTWDFSEGLAMVRNGPFGIGKCGFIDKTGKVVIPFKYDQGDLGFKGGMALVVLDRKYGFIDKTGNEIVPPKYKFAFSFNEGLAVVKEDKWGCIDSKGNIKIPLIYDDASKTVNDGLIMFVKEKKCGYVDKTGKIIIPFKYTQAKDFYQGLAAVRLGNKWGFINKTGKVIIPIIYDDAFVSLINGRLKVKLNDKYLDFDKNGKEIK